MRVTHDGITGLGEMAPGDVRETADAAEADLAAWATQLDGLAPWEQQRGRRRAAPSTPAAPAAAAGLDLALHDWLGKRAGLPLWRLWGLSLDRIVPTSLTVGINPPEVVREKVPEIMTPHRGPRAEGEARQPRGPRARPGQLRRRAGGGRAPRTDDAVALARATPTAGGSPTPPWRWPSGWPRAACRTWSSRWRVAARTTCPTCSPAARCRIYADESVRVAADVPALADRVHGVNLKLMKTGGLREAMRLVHTARAHGLGVMIGCMGESSLSITAGAHLSPLVDHVDLDSHLNLLDDPFVGAAWTGGRVVPNDQPGLGRGAGDDPVRCAASRC